MAAEEEVENAWMVPLTWIGFTRVNVDEKTGHSGAVTG